MRFRRDFIFRLHTIGIAFVAFVAIWFHRSADARRVDDLTRQVSVLREELSRKADSVPSGGSSAASVSGGEYLPVYNDPPPRIRIVGSGTLGRYLYLDCRLCDGVIRRCYMRRDPEKKSRDIQRIAEILDELQSWLWAGGIDVSLCSATPPVPVSAPVSSTDADALD